MKLLLTSKKDIYSPTEEFSKKGFQLVLFIYVPSVYVPVRGT